MHPALAGLAYFAVVFAAGFALGALRTLVVAPRVGALAAVLMELPVILLVSWVACGRIVRRFAAPPGTVARLVMGAVGFGLLMGAEILLGAAFGRTPAAQAAALATPEGLAGLAGQVAFALFPLLAGRRDGHPAGGRR